MQVGVAITLNFVHLAGLHFWKALVHTVNTFLINSGTCMQICKHAHRMITLSECNVAVSITVAVSYNTEDQSPACTSFCSLACLSGTACCHGVSGMACSFGLHTKPAAVGSVLASHSRHTSQSSINIQLDNVKTHIGENRLKWVVTVSAHTKDDFVIVWFSLY